MAFCDGFDFFNGIGNRHAQPTVADHFYIVDVVADYAIAAQLGRPVPTIDIRVDYHKAAMPGDLTAKGRVVRNGSQYSTAEAYVYDKDGALVASGRGTYFTAPPK